MWVEHLNERQCWELLDRAKVGRVGVLVDSEPAGFELMALDVGDPAKLRRWEGWLDELRIAHTPIRPAHLGR
jgi:hypothetical protein